MFYDGADDAYLRGSLDDTNNEASTKKDNNGDPNFNKPKPFLLKAQPPSTTELGKGDEASQEKLQAKPPPSKPQALTTHNK
jgi:hypothetical protein